MLDKSRKYQIDKDFKSWVNLHNPFFEIISFMKELRKREIKTGVITCLLYTSPSPRDVEESRMPSSA